MAGTNHSDLVVLEPDGKSPRLITHNRSDVSVEQSTWARKPAWAPDASRIAFVSDREKHDMSLWQTTPDGTKVEPLLLTRPYSGGVDWPTWSPNGSDIAFVSFSSGVSQIHVLNLRQKQERELSNGPAGAYDPAWSPDGKFVAFVARGEQQGYLALARVSDGSIHRLPIEGILRSPTWSPGGDTMAFIRQNGDRFDVQITRLRLDGDTGAAAPSAIDETQGIDPTAGLSWIA